MGTPYDDALRELWDGRCSSRYHCADPTTSMGDHEDQSYSVMTLCGLVIDYRHFRDYDFPLEFVKNSGLTKCKRCLKSKKLGMEVLASI